MRRRRPALDGKPELQHDADGRVFGEGAGPGGGELRGPSGRAAALADRLNPGAGRGDRRLADVLVTGAAADRRQAAQVPAPGKGRRPREIEVGAVYGRQPIGRKQRLFCLSPSA